MSSSQPSSALASRVKTKEFFQCFGISKSMFFRVSSLSASSSLRNFTPFGKAKSCMTLDLYSTCLLSETCGNWKILLGGILELRDVSRSTSLRPIT